MGTLPPHPGGSAISCAELLGGIAKLGNSIRSLSPITPDKLQSGDRFATEHPELEVTRFEVPQFDTGLPIPTPAWYRALERSQIEDNISRLVAYRRPDVIFIGRESFVWDVPSLARDFSIPSLITIRGGARTARLLSDDFPDASQLLAQYRKVDQIVTVANHLTAGFHRLGLDKVKTIANAIDLSRFRPRPKERFLLQELNINDDDIVVMHIANLQSRKRSIDLVRSAERTIRKNQRLLYVIVGDGSQRQSLMEACENAGISRRFRFTGWVEYPRIPDFVNLADLVVVPSESEGLARVYLETQACARVLLASDIPPAREVIVDGKTGYLFEKGSIDELATKILLAASDLVLRTRIGSNALKTIERHSISKAVDSYLSVAHELVAAHISSRSNP